MMRTSTADHEAAHAAAAIMAGCRVVEVRVGGLDDGSRGAVRFRRGPLNRMHVTIYLAGGLVARVEGATDYPEWPPTFPVLPGRGDQGDVHDAVKTLGLDAEDYADVVRAAKALVATQEFRYLALVLSAACNASEPRTLSEERVEQLAGHDLIERYARS
ncbi:MAG: hypothetical protein AABM43_07895 [Actinomycetota bacterium]